MARCWSAHEEAPAPQIVELKRPLVLMSVPAFLRDCRARSMRMHMACPTVWSPPERLVTTPTTAEAREGIVDVTELFGCGPDQFLHSLGVCHAPQPGSALCGLRAHPPPFPISRALPWTYQRGVGLLELTNTPDPRCQSMHAVNQP